MCRLLQQLLDAVWSVTSCTQHAAQAVVHWVHLQHQAAIAGHEQRAGGKLIMLMCLATSGLQCLHYKKSAHFAACSTPTFRRHALYALTGLLKPSSRAWGPTQWLRAAACMAKATGLFALGWLTVATLLWSAMRSAISNGQGYPSSRLAAFASLRLQAPVEKDSCPVALPARCRESDAGAEEPQRWRLRTCLPALWEAESLVTMLAVWLMGGSVITWLAGKLLWEAVRQLSISSLAASSLMGQHASKEASGVCIAALELGVPIAAHVLLPAFTGCSPFHGAMWTLAQAASRAVLFAPWLVALLLALAFSLPGYV